MKSLINSHLVEKATILVWVVFSFLACAREKEREPVFESETAFSDIRVPKSQVPFYADLSNYNLIKNDSKDATRAEVEEETVTLEELLDFSKTRTRHAGNYEIVQTAFKQNEDEVYSLTYSTDHVDDQVIPTRVKKFLISASSATGEKYVFVAVLITSAEYFQNNRDFDFFEKPSYTGTIFYCTPEGSLIQTNEYVGGRIYGVQMLTPEESLNDNDPETKRIILLQSVSTRVEWITHWSGEPGICVDFKPKDKPGGGGAGGDGNDDDDDVGWGSPNGPGGNVQDRDYITIGYGVLLPNIPPEVTQMCQVKLTSNSNYVTMIGSGTYEKGSVINVGFSLDYLVLDEHAVESEFRYWAGTFRFMKTVSFAYTVMEDVESTAYFNISKPCSDGVKSNPLKEMRIAPTDSGNYLKGLYKATVRRWEDGKPKYHWGLDLAAEEGTPVYAIQSGTIKRVYSECPEGEDGNLYNRRYGNQIIIECQGYIDPYNDDGIISDDSTIYIQYSHLQYGHAIGFNYREGRLFQQGDKVYAGDLIGYTGRTGNAWSVKNPHLHLGVSPTFVEGNPGFIPEHSYIDPADYINGEIDIEYLKAEMAKKEKIAGYNNPNINLIKVTTCN